MSKEISSDIAALPRRAGIRSEYQAAATIVPRLESALPLLRRKLHRKQIERFNDGFSDWWESARYPGEVTYEHIALYLVSTLVEHLRLIALLHNDWVAFKANFGYAETEADRLAVLLEAARSLGADEAAVRKDSEAVSRWFGQDAIAERFLRRIAEAEQKAAFTLELLANMAHAAFHEADNSAECQRIWGRLGLERILLQLLAFEGDCRVRTAAMQTLCAALHGGGRHWDNGQLLPVSNEVRVAVISAATDRKQPVWMQVAAFQALPHISTEASIKVLKLRLSPDFSADDDLFVRTHAVVLLATLLDLHPEHAPLLTGVADDPSDHVRQTVVRILPSHDPELFCRMLRHDPSPQVRGAAVMTMLDERAWQHHDVRLQLLAALLEVEQEPFVIRCGLLVSTTIAELLVRKGDQQGLDLWLETLQEPVQRLHVAAPHLSVRRWSAQVLERFWLLSRSDRYDRFCVLSRFVSTLELKQWCRLPKDFTDLDELTRQMAILAQNGMPLALRKKRGGYRIFRGYRFVFRWWRVLYELLHPSPDKRQAYRHTVGRSCEGEFRMPSEVLSEVSPTKVPGEPLFMDEESGWRPYMPLPDDFLASLRPMLRPRPVVMVTSEGKTRITQPRSLGERVRAAFKLTCKFADYAELRNWQADSLHRPDEYVKAIMALGFEVSFTPHGTEERVGEIDPQVARFFPLTLPFVDQPLIARISDYFFSVYENSLDDLLLFCFVLLLIFLLERVWLHKKARTVRKRFPLIVGGWGTRGKSGTERLKGALFSALGYSVLSKTSGCEAMVLYAHPFGEQKEMFIFRPYDKATIWEQHNLLLLADRLGADVMLWECMGLNPSYVGILQNTWMRDDLSTITNAYPDHEDIQGPAGINVAEVMINFIPNRSHLITTEEQMLPIIADGARLAETKLTSINWLQAGLIPRDLLQRFPYDEHPYNVALALAIAAELGMSHDVALKEMADRVVPDLGVLKTYPVAVVQGRKLQFVNGMSANDRYGCLANWKRTGLEQVHPDHQPGNWVSVVVNNRADRIARSKVFARILVEDINADRYLLIGSNLKGLRGYIEQALDEHIAQLTLWPEMSRTDCPDPGELLAIAALRNRVATDSGQLVERLRAMLAGVGFDPSGLDGRSWEEAECFIAQLKDEGYAWHGAVVEQTRRDSSSFRTYQELLEEVKHAGHERQHELDARFRETFRSWFIDRLVLVDDYFTTGEQLVHLLAGITPPGYLNRIMGLQNIKGTGLDFVYRWQAWGQCHRACIALADPDPAVNRPALAELSSFPYFGLLCEEFVRECIATVRPLTHTQNEVFQASLDSIKSALENAMKEVRMGLSVTSRNDFVEWLFSSVEAFLDAGDSIRRRKVSQQIYRDLVDERISTQRAASELQALTLRQKGGWLIKQLQKLKHLIGRS